MWALTVCGGVLRFLDHIKNEDSPGPPIGSHHAFFSDDQEPYPVTDIADLIRDSYEVQEPLFHPLRSLPSWKPKCAWDIDMEEGFWLLHVSLDSGGPYVYAEIWKPVCGAD